MHNANNSMPWFTTSVPSTMNSAFAFAVYTTFTLNDFDLDANNNIRSVCIKPSTRSICEPIFGFHFIWFRLNFLSTPSYKCGLSVSYLYVPWLMHTQCNIVDQSPQSKISSIAKTAKQYTLIGYFRCFDVYTKCGAFNAKQL